jgi:hypothetical protein
VLSLPSDLLAAARRDRERAVDTFIACQRALYTVQLYNPNFGRDAVKRLRALAINKTLPRHLAALDRVVAENGELTGDIVRGTSGRASRGSSSRRSKPWKPTRLSGLPPHRRRRRGD